MLKTSNMSSIPTRIPQQQHRDPGRITQANRSPSKLQLMQMQMHQRQLREKEEKMSEFRNQNQNNSYQDDGYGPSDGSGSVRRFFQERREMSDQNGHVPNINQHYNKVKQGTYQYQTQNGHSPQGQVRNYGSIHRQKEGAYARRPPIPVKHSAGRDKAHPLAPIDRTPKQTPHGSRQSSRKSSAQSSNSAVNGFNGARPRLPGVRKAPASEPVPYESDAENFHNGENNQVSSRSTGTHKKSTNFREWQEKQKRIRQISAGQAQTESEPVDHFGAQPDPAPIHKPSDFEKWQAEQDENRRLRLEKHKEQNGGNVSNRSNRSNFTPKGQSSPSPKKPSAASPHTVKKNVLKSRINSRKHLFPSESYADPVDDDDSGEEENDEISQKQRELEEMINRQQAELARIQQEREAEDERERKEKERRQKRAAEQRERQRKQREADARERREQEERERKEEEKERRQRQVEQEMENERLMRLKASEQHQSPRVQPRYEYEESGGEDEPPPFPRKPAKPSRAQRHPPAKQQKAPPPPKQRYEPEPDRGDSNTAFFLEAAEQAEFEKVDLAPCKNCGRKFARDRLDKHLKVCKQASKKKRKVFDPVKHRTEGTELAQYVKDSRRKPEPKPKKSNWREQHDNFIKAIRYAKAVTDAEKTGGDMAALPPPPVTQNSDYKQCPYCERKFNPSTAERHIPRCKDIKSRPAPPKARRR